MSEDLCVGGGVSVRTFVLAATAAARVSGNLCWRRRRECEEIRVGGGVCDVRSFACVRTSVLVAVS